jgi:hypothetical protein
MPEREMKLRCLKLTKLSMPAREMKLKCPKLTKVIYA